MKNEAIVIKEVPYEGATTQSPRPIDSFATPDLPDEIEYRFDKRKVLEQFRGSKGGSSFQALSNSEAQSQELHNMMYMRA